VAVLREIIEDKHAKLVTLDTWHRMAGRAEENSNTEQGEPIDVALSLRDDFQATVLILDHTGHAQLHARGASAKEDDVDASWLIKLGSGDADDESRAIETPRTLVHRKAKDEDLRDPARLKLVIDNHGEAVAIVDPIQPAAPVKARKRPPHQEQVQELIQALDNAKQPADMSYREIQAWDDHRRPGFSATQRAAREVANFRRLRGEETRKAIEKGKQALEELEELAGPEHPCPNCGGVTLPGGVRNPDGWACIECKWTGDDPPGPAAS
jgi:AAA domain